MCVLYLAEEIFFDKALRFLYLNFLPFSLVHLYLQRPLRRIVICEYEFYFSFIFLSLSRPLRLITGCGYVQG